MRKSVQLGFTLIETLVVICITGLLLLVIFPTYLERKETSTATQLADILRDYAIVLSQLAEEQIDWNDEAMMETLPELINEMLPRLSEESIIGGNWEWSANWEIRQIEIRLVNHQAGIQVINRVDHLLDDGNLATGVITGDRDYLKMMLPH